MPYSFNGDFDWMMLRNIGHVAMTDLIETF